MKRILVLLLLGFTVLGCNTQEISPQGRPAGSGDLEKVKVEMTSLFGALEMYAHDHALVYPESLEPLLPKYLDALPKDPMNQQPLIYQKTERGYLLSTSADYSSAGAERGFPQMDQDGFFALKESDFTEVELPGEL